jgi:hypothetical protein
MMTPDPAGNSFNWIVGHIVRTRNQALGLLGTQPLFDDTDFAAYGGPSPVGKALPLTELKRRFDALGPALATALEKAAPSHLEAKAPFSLTNNPNETVGSLLASIVFHEAYG